MYKITLDHSSIKILRDKNAGSRLCEKLTFVILYESTAFASHTYFHYGIIIENALHNGMNIFHFSSLYYFNIILSIIILFIYN